MAGLFIVGNSCWW